MVQVIQKYDPMAHLGQLFGQGVGQSFSQVSNQVLKKQQTENALEKLNYKPGQNQLDAIKDLLSGTAGLDDQGKILQTIAPLYLQQLQAENLKNLGNERKGNVPGAASQKEDMFKRNGNTISMKDDAGVINKNVKTTPFFPNNVGPQDIESNTPQSATDQQKRPILDNEGIIDLFHKRHKDLLKNGINQDPSITYQNAINENEQNKKYNEEVDKDLANRIAAQQANGDLAEAALQKLIPNASDEERAIFRKEGEDVSLRSKSEAQKQIFLAKQASKYKDQISNIQKGLSAPRLQNSLSRSIRGTESSLRQAENDARSQVKPLIDKGLYDKSRQLLEGAGFYPEERERIVFGELPKAFSETVDSIPKAKTEKKNYSLFNTGIGNLQEAARPTQYEQSSLDELKNNILDVFKKDPGFEAGKESQYVNLIQLRKLYEDKGYDWRVFKDTLNDLYAEGEIQLTDDQQNQFNSYLNEPPLDNIGKILYKLKLRGR